jgi:hypothetical protein
MTRSDLYAWENMMKKDIINKRIGIKYHKGNELFIFSGSYVSDLIKLCTKNVQRLINHNIDIYTSQKYYNDIDNNNFGNINKNSGQKNYDYDALMNKLKYLVGMTGSQKNWNNILTTYSEPNILAQRGIVGNWKSGALLVTHNYGKYKNDGYDGKYIYYSSMISNIKDKPHGLFEHPCNASMYKSYRKKRPIAYFIKRRTTEEYFKMDNSKDTWQYIGNCIIKNIRIADDMSYCIFVMKLIKDYVNI